MEEIMLLFFFCYLLPQNYLNFMSDDIGTLFFFFCQRSLAPSLGLLLTVELCAVGIALIKTAPLHLCSTHRMTQKWPRTKRTVWHRTKFRPSWKATGLSTATATATDSSSKRNSPTTAAPLRGARQSSGSPPPVSTETQLGNTRDHCCRVAVEKNQSVVVFTQFVSPFEIFGFSLSPLHFYTFLCPFPHL